MEGGGFYNLDNISTTKNVQFHWIADISPLPIDVKDFHGWQSNNARNREKNKAGEENVGQYLSSSHKNLASYTALLFGSLSARELWLFVVLFHSFW